MLVATFSLVMESSELTYAPQSSVNGAYLVPHAEHLQPLHRVSKYPELMTVRLGGVKETL